MGEDEYNSPQIRDEDASRQRQTEQQITKALIRSVLTVSPIVDRSASWLLIGIGASITLIVGNLDQTSDLIGNTPLKITLYLLLVAALLGIAQKSTATMIQYYLHIQESIENALRDPIDAAPSPDSALNQSIIKIQEVVPWYLRTNFRRKFKKAKLDPLIGEKTSAHTYNRQLVYAILQLAVSMLAIIVVAFNI